tara:strand:- start:2798 stop:4546 length:1749 start_codon:yes stop_codon:yes gene_type:complete
MINKRLILIILPILLLPVYLQVDLTQVLKLRTFDALIERQEPSGFFTILNITEQDITEEGGYPLPRQRLAEIHVELLNKGALGVGWVMSFPQPDRMGGDEIFAEALSYGASVIAMFEDESGVQPPTTGTVILGDNAIGIKTLGVIPNIKTLANSSSQGIAVAPVEIDNLVRRLPLLLKTEDGFVSAFGTEIMKQLAGNNTYIIKTNELGIQEITVQGLPPVKTDSLARKWISWVKTEETNLAEMKNIEGRYVIVGVTANGVMPQIATPVGLLEPHKIQAALAESILIENSPYIPDWSLSFELLITAFTLVLVWLFIMYLGITKGVIMATVTAVGTAVSGYTLIGNGLLLDVTWSLISQFITGSIAFYLRFREQYKLRQLIKKQFEHYLDPRQVKQLQNNPELLKLGGEKRYCTFLFTDVRGFTALSEILEPEEVTHIMNRALTIQSNAVKEYGGMVDKYIGDAMMAIFNAPIDLPDHENRAILTALKIQEDMRKANLGIEIGIGINSGEAIVGNMGSDSRFDYSAIGDAVNTAARLESATKEAGVDLIIGYNTKKSSKYKLKLLKPIKVKGKKHKLSIYTYG